MVGVKFGKTLFIHISENEFKQSFTTQEKFNKMIDGFYKLEIKSGCENIKICLHESEV